MTVALIDSGPIVAYYNGADDWHSAAKEFYGSYKGILITTEAVCTEVMRMLDDTEVQNEFLKDIAGELYKLEPLVPSDYKAIAELNQKYKNVPGDFVDLSLVAIAERLKIFDVVSLDKDFDIYRSYGAKKTFRQLFSKWDIPKSDKVRR